MDEANLLSSIIEKSIGQASQFLYLSLDSEQINQVKMRFQNSCVVVDMNDKEVYSMPFAPFTKIIRQTDIDLKIIENACYSLHKDTFLSFFHSGFANERYDLPVFDEVDYEKLRYSQAFIEILNSVNKPIIILNAQNLPAESVNTIRSIDEENFFGKIILCFDLQNKETFTDTEQSNIFEIQSKENFYSLVKLDKLHENEIHKTKIEFPTDFDTFYTIFHNYRCFFCFAQAEILMNFIKSKSFSIYYTKEQQSKLYLEAGILFFYQKRFLEASMSFMKVLESHLNDDTYIFALIYSSLFCYSQFQFEKGKFFATEAMALTEKNKNSPFHLLSHYCEYLNFKNEKKELYINEYLQIVEILEKSNLKNITVDAMITVPWYFNQKIEILQLLLRNIESAKTKCQELGNYYGLSTACQWKAIINSKLGNRQEAFNHYRRCNAIRTKIGSPLSVAKIRNGLSYEYLLQGDYTNAYDVTNSFLKRIGEVKDFNEIVITLMNLAKILFYSGNLASANKLFTYAQNMTHLYGLTDLCVANANDIYVYQSLISMMNNLDIQAKISYSKIPQDSADFSVNVIVLKIFLNSLFLLSDQKKDESIAEFENALDFCEKNCSEQFYLKAYLLFQYGFILAKNGLKKESQFYWQEGIDFSRKNNLIFYTNNICMLEPLELGDFIPNFSPLGVTADYLDQILIKEKVMKSITASEMHSVFLKNVLNYSNETLTSEIPQEQKLANFTQKFTSLLSAQFNMSHIVIFEKTDTWHKTFENKNLQNYTDVQLDEIYSQFAKLRPKSTPYYLSENRHIVYADLSTNEKKQFILTERNYEIANDDSTLNFLESLYFILKFQFTLAK